MSLRYLDINPVSTIQGGIYSKLIFVFPGETGEYRFVEKQVDSYYNDKFQNSLTCNTCSSGYTYAGFFKGLLFYNSNLKIYSSFVLGDDPKPDTAYQNDKNILYAVDCYTNQAPLAAFMDFPQGIEYFSSILYIKNNSSGYKYIGKMNGKITMFITTGSDVTFSEYTGEKLKGLEGRNISFIKEGETDVYAIFKVGTNLYRYNYQDDFIDDNIILRGILPEDIENFSLGAKIDDSFNFQEFYLVDFVNHKYYTATLTDTPPTPPVSTTFKCTINFADGDSTTSNFEREIHYVETYYLTSGSCTFNFYDKENKIITSLARLNPDSYKYAETITINGNQYPINTKQQITLNSDFTIQVNNGVVAYYYVAFKNDTMTLQQERLQESILPVYKGATPTKEGYVFTGWEPTPYPVDKQQTYQAVFEEEPYTITIVDEGGSSALEVKWNGLIDDGRFNEPIIKIETLLVTISGSVLMTFWIANDNVVGSAILKYNNGLIPTAFIIGETIYDFNKVYKVNIISDTTIKIRGNSIYAIRFLNYDNTVLESVNVLGGITPTYTGETPYRKGYDFTGWAPTLYPADKNQDYVATFEINTFTIRFLDDDGTVLETQTFDYGTIPFYSKGAPTKEGYVFNGWSPTPYPANKDQDYKATYRTTTFLITL